MSSPFNMYMAGYDTPPGQNSPPIPKNEWEGDDSMFSSSVTFQMPEFLYTGAPKLAYGGGAEVISGSSAAWLNNSGFSGHNFQYGDSQAEFERNGGPSIFKSSSTLSDNFFARSPTPSFVGDPLQHAQHLPTSPLINAGGLPMYSATGIDVLSILSRVVTRPHPAISLGPVDLTCAFLIADVRRHDCPVVYTSPSFTQLTGYSEVEVVGRNCRFLQSPIGFLEKGGERPGGIEPVKKLWKAIENHGECQVQMINYKKGGQAFINLVTLIPVSDATNPDEIVYYVGFQVDLNTQPTVILERLRNGTYSANSGYNSIPPVVVNVAPSTAPPTTMAATISKDLHKLMHDPRFQISMPYTLGVNILTGKGSLASTNATAKMEKVADTSDGLHLHLLESLPDFAMVLSLKGAFLYVGPSVRRVLGYESRELVGKTIEDICHQADIVPLMRELKESSGAADGSGIATIAEDTMLAKKARTVDTIFRVRAKDGRCVWLDCTGRMHVEAGKGRKAVILSARPMAMPNVSIGSDSSKEGTVFSTLSDDGIFLSVSREAHAAFGYQIGMDISSFVGEESVDSFQTALLSKTGSTTIRCDMHTAMDRKVPVEVVFRPTIMTSTWVASSHKTCSLATAPIVCQISVVTSSSGSTSSHHRQTAPQRVYQELDTSRGSSWQYEIQQIRIANERLLEEIRVLEKSSSSKAAETAAAPSGSSLWSPFASGFSGQQAYPPYPVAATYSTRADGSSRAEGSGTKRTRDGSDIT